MTKSKTYTATIPFIREEGLKGITTMALLKVITTRRMTNETIIKAVTKCLTHWVNKTKEGRHAWSQSCADFNIGDFATYEEEINDSLPHSVMTQYGIMDWEVLDCGDSEGVIEFDRVLVDQKKLPDDWHLVD